jgi:hypothetical protein
MPFFAGAEVLRTSRALRNTFRRRPLRVAALVHA